MVAEAKEGRERLSQNLSLLIRAISEGRERLWPVILPSNSMEFRGLSVVIPCMSRDKHSTLIFVYNADSGLFNTMTDIAHKMLSPSTYSCNLCAISHGLLSEKKEWREFIEQLGVPVVFLHRDEFEQQYRDIKTSYPAILRHDGDNISVLIPNDAINRCKDIAALRQLIEINLGSGLKRGR